MSVPLSVGYRVLRDLLWTIMFVFSVHLPCLTPVCNNYSVHEPKQFPLNASSLSPTPTPSFFFIPHILPKMVAFAHGLWGGVCIVNLSVLSREFLLFIVGERVEGVSHPAGWMEKDHYGHLVSRWII